MSTEGAVVVTDNLFFNFHFQISCRLFIHSLSRDLGLVNTEGTLEVIGRLKDLIIKGGVNISPEEIEAALTGLSFFTFIESLREKRETGSSL